MSFKPLEAIRKDDCQARPARLLRLDNNTVSIYTVHAPGAMLAASDLGFVTVSSMESTRQAASVAAVSALILTSDGSHT